MGDGDIDPNGRRLQVKRFEHEVDVVVRGGG